MGKKKKKKKETEEVREIANEMEARRERRGEKKSVNGGKYSCKVRDFWGIKADWYTDGDVYARTAGRYRERRFALTR